MSALDAAADARGPGIEDLLPGFQRMMRSSAPGHAVDQSETFERLPEVLAAIGLVGEIALLVALDQRFRQTKVVDVRRSHLGLPHNAARS
jgi:hypothetical protein